MIKENRLSIIILIVAALVIFVLGAYSGILYQSQKTQGQAGPQPVDIEVIKKLSSPIVASALAYGQVSEINGNSITLRYLNDTLTIKMKDTSNVSSFNQAAGQSGSSAIQQLQLKDIKVGDNVNIAFKLLPDGTLEGQSVVIISSSL